jgi:hypothetical protein
MVNPASSDSSGKFSVRLGYSFLQGLFEGVNRSYFDADLKPGKGKKISYSRFGIFIQSSNDGGFINRTRYYGRYSRTIGLGNGHFISLGLGFGAITVTLKGSQSFSGGNSTVPDGYSGIWYYRKNIKIGISAEQITQSVLTPIQESFRLYPVFNMNAVYIAELSHNVKFNNHLYARREHDSDLSFDYAPVLLLSDIIQAGANFRFKRGIAIMAGVDTHTIGLGNISFMGSFLIGTRKLSTSADNKFEISARYFL